MSIDNQDANSENKTFHDCWTWITGWIKTNPLWAAAHILNLFAAFFLYFGETSGTSILPVVIFMCIIFVQIYTDPIKAVPVDADQKAKADLEEIRSEQRNKWMIFAYSFMLISLLLTFYPFINPLFNFTEKTQIKSDGTAQIESTGEKTKTDEGRYLNTLRERPIAVFIGCSLDNKRRIYVASLKTQLYLIQKMEKKINLKKPHKQRVSKGIKLNQLYQLMLIMHGLSTSADISSSALQMAIKNTENRLPAK